MEEIRIVCKKCKVEKNVSEMKKDPRCKNGVQKVCRECENIKKKNRYSTKINDEEWVIKEKERKNKYRDEHKDEINEKKRKARKEKENDFFACEICQMLVKNYSIHEKSEYHNKNQNNGWKEDKEKYYFEFHQTRIKELKKMFVDWKKDLEIEKEKMAQEKLEQKKARKREYDRRYREMKLLKKWEMELENEERGEKEGGAESKEQNEK